MIVKIKDKLRSDKDTIIHILEDIGCHNIKPHHINPTIRFGMDDEGSGTGNKIDSDTLFYKSYSSNKRLSNANGDIITLVSEMLKMSIGEAISWLSKYLGLEFSISKKVDIKLPFGGFFKEISKNHDEIFSYPLIYPNTYLADYKSGATTRFIKDGISALTQEEFGIGYDIMTNRITIPWVTEQGELVGIMGRINKEITDKKYNYKYLPIIPFSKSKVLYGFYQNYKSIVNDELIIIAESEKSVLQARDMGINNVVALGGNIIHPRQINLIKSTFATVILALDEGMEIQHAINEAKKLLIKNPFFSNDIYVVDMENDYVEKGSKCSIFDLGKEKVDKILKENLILVE
ncbi:MAG: hypothetical protein ACRCVJ_11725 [Clostridium sp.]|uniref:hypothetical protein n=1 Tax=Clostridium sp. TaxID=1506 RepID=UPI003F395F1F